MTYSSFRVRIRDFHIPELPLEFKWGFGLPQLKNHVDPFQGHKSLSLGVRQSEELMIRRHSALTKAAIQSSVRQVVEKRQTHGNIRWVVLRDDGNSRTQANSSSPGEHIGDENVIGGNRLPRHAVVLADPGFSETQFFCPNNQLDVLVKALRPRLFGWVQWHHEETQFHNVPFQEVTLRRRDLQREPPAILL